MHFRVAMVGIAALAACNPQAAGHSEASGRAQAAVDRPADGFDAPAEPRSDQPMPSGSSCVSHRDCVGEQVCVEGICQYRRTSVAAETLAIAAARLRDAEELKESVRAYRAAVGAYRAVSAPVPAHVSCAFAEASLLAATDAKEREAAAHQADDCFRNSLPGDPNRTRALGAVAKMRYDGLALARFDDERPAERFFTDQPTRPTIDSLSLVIAPDATGALPPKVAEKLVDSSVRRAVGRCFVTSWEAKRGREADAELILRQVTHPENVRGNAVFRASLRAEVLESNPPSFGSCLSATLPAALEATPHQVQNTSWQVSLRIGARLL